MSYTKGPWKMSRLISGEHHINAANGECVAFARPTDNALLIAAAPELLEACEEAARYIWHLGATARVGKFYELPILEGAIKKAKGES